MLILSMIFRGKDFYLKIIKVNLEHLYLSRKILFLILFKEGLAFKWEENSSHSSVSEDKELYLTTMMKKDTSISMKKEQRKKRSRRVKLMIKMTMMELKNHHQIICTIILPT